MNGEEILKQLLNYLPIVIAVLVALGMGKALASLVHLATDKARAAAKASPSPIDDALIGPIADKLDALADDLADGHLDGVAAKARLSQISAALKVKR